MSSEHFLDIFPKKMTRSGIKLVGEHSVGMVVPLEKPASPGMSWKIETFRRDPI